MNIQKVNSIIENFNSLNPVNVSPIDSYTFKYLAEHIVNKSDQEYNMYEEDKNEFIKLNTALPLLTEEEFIKYSQKIDEDLKYKRLAKEQEAVVNNYDNVVSIFNYK